MHIFFNPWATIGPQLIQMFNLNFTTMKNPRTNSKLVRNAVQKTLFDSLNVSEENINDFDPNANPWNYVYEDFKRVSFNPRNWQLFKTEQRLFRDYLQGLPGLIDLPYTTWEIIEIMEDKWHLKQPKNADSEKSLHLFYYLIYVEFKKLVK